MSALTDLQAQVAQNTSVEASAVQLIQGIAQQLATAIAGGDTAQLQALTASLSSSAAALAAAVTANTPAAPAAAQPTAAATTSAAATPAADPAKS